MCFLALLEKGALLTQGRLEPQPVFVLCVLWAHLYVGTFFAVASTRRYRSLFFCCTCESFEPPCRCSLVGDESTSEFCASASRGLSASRVLGSESFVDTKPGIRFYSGVGVCSQSNRH